MVPFPVGNGSSYVDFPHKNFFFSEVVILTPFFPQFKLLPPGLSLPVYRRRPSTVKGFQDEPRCSPSTSTKVVTFSLSPSDSPPLGSLYPASLPHCVQYAVPTSFLFPSNSLFESDWPADVIPLASVKTFLSKDRIFFLEPPMFKLSKGETLGCSPSTLGFGVTRDVESAARSTCCALRLGRFRTFSGEECVRHGNRNVSVFFSSYSFLHLLRR